MRYNIAYAICIPYAQPRILHMYCYLFVGYRKVKVDGGSCWERRPAEHRRPVYCVKVIQLCFGFLTAILNLRRFDCLYLTFILRDITSMIARKLTGWNQDKKHRCGIQVGLCILH